jgi:hypothetical protein
VGHESGLARTGGKRTYALLAAGLTATAILGWALISHVTARGAAVVTVQNYAAATFTPVEESSHNHAGGSVCAAFVPS